MLVHMLAKSSTKEESLAKRLGATRLLVACTIRRKVEGIMELVYVFVVVASGVVVEVTTILDEIWDAYGLEEEEALTIIYVFFTMLTSG